MCIGFNVWCRVSPLTLSGVFSGADFMDKYYCIESFWDWKLRRLKPSWSNIPRSINCRQTSASPLISRRIRARKMPGFGGKLWFDAVFSWRNKYYCTRSFEGWELRRLAPGWSSIPRSISSRQTPATRHWATSCGRAMPAIIVSRIGKYWGSISTWWIIATIKKCLSE